MRRARPTSIRRAVLALLFALFLPFGLAACGGDDDAGDGVTPAETDEGAPTDPEAGQTEGEGENLGGEASD
jgi:hypothetical protein